MSHSSITLFLLIGLSATTAQAIPLTDQSLPSADSLWESGAFPLEGSRAGQILSMLTGKADAWWAVAYGGNEYVLDLSTTELTKDRASVLATGSGLALPPTGAAIAGTWALQLSAPLQLDFAFTPLSVPDAGSTLFLTALGLVGLASLRKRFRAC